MPMGQLCSMLPGSSKSLRFQRMITHCFTGGLPFWLPGNGVWISAGKTAKTQLRSSELRTTFLHRKLFIKQTALLNKPDASWRYIRLPNTWVLLSRYLVYESICGILDSPTVSLQVNVDLCEFEPYVSRGRRLDAFAYRCPHGSPGCSGTTSPGCWLNALL